MTMGMKPSQGRVNVVPKQGELGQVLARREVRNVVDQQEEAKVLTPEQTLGKTTYKFIFVCESQMTV